MRVVEILLGAARPRLVPIDLREGRLRGVELLPQRGGQRRLRPRPCSIRSIPIFVRSFLVNSIKFSRAPQDVLYAVHTSVHTSMVGRG